MFSETLMPRFSETDALGHINNTALPVWFEAARTPFFRFFTPDLDCNKWKLIVAKIEVEFKGELFYGQEITINSSISRIGNSSFVICQEVYQHNELCAVGHATMVRYDFDKKASVALNDTEKAQLMEHFKAS
ncbi:MAG: thioesterase family protein [Pseudomonadota bacterium]|uniref:acyl-CoA thioesterase n=1 Tax=Pseudoalteromonas spongiae TaxID=298657 RepID=UPI00110B319F|nr:thioesterase family protein [Pseudoalteromonas spongiae]MEC8207321.1 thioesterase family protein [Pseudomonadota bacterium]TMO86663.1 thioesterase [Pseudoalteromonas spongiae]